MTREIAPRQARRARRVRPQGDAQRTLQDAQDGISRLVAALSRPPDEWNETTDRDALFRWIARERPDMTMLHWAYTVLAARRQAMGAA